MATAGQLEDSVALVERFRIRLVDDLGRDVRSDKSMGHAAYRYRTAANSNMTVSDWRRVRFTDLRLPGGVEVLMGDGTPAHGNYLLSTVRATY